VPWLVLTLERDQIATLVTRLEGEAQEGAAVLPWTSGPELDRACAALAGRLDARVTVIDPDGTVRGESQRESASLQNHADRPEFQAALADGRGHAVRWSKTLDERLLYAALRDERDGATRVVRIAVPVNSVTEHLLRLRGPIGMELHAAIVLGVAASWLL
jgi:two-component system phosphate regulon sensor histidine kinase PhoR